MFRAQMRRGIVEQSIKILRRHGKHEEEIRFILLDDFRIDEETLDGLLRQSAGSNETG